MLLGKSHQERWKAEEDLRNNIYKRQPLRRFAWIPLIIHDEHSRKENSGRYVWLQYYWVVTAWKDPRSGEVILACDSLDIARRFVTKEEATRFLKGLSGVRT